MMCQLVVIFMILFSTKHQLAHYEFLIFMYSVFVIEKSRPMRPRSTSMWMLYFQLVDTGFLLLQWKVNSQCLSTGSFKFQHHTPGNWTLDHDWLQTSCDVTKSWSSVSTEKLSPFIRSMWKQPFNIKLWTYVTLHSQEQISEWSYKQSKKHFCLKGL